MKSNFSELGLDSVAIGRAIRHAGLTRGYQLNMTQLNKLLYIAYGVHLVRFKERLTREHPAAWPYGPVFPRMFNTIRLSDPITDAEYKELPERICSLLDEVVRLFGRYSANALSSWSHQDGSPWARTLERSGGMWNEKIDDEDIFSYFYNFVKMEVPG